MLLYKKWNTTTTQHLRLARVEPVLCAVLNLERSLLSLTRLGRNATSSVYPVNLLVVTARTKKLQPRHTSQTIRSLARILGRIRLGIKLGLDKAVVDNIGLELEEGRLVLCELVVAGEARGSLWALGDGVVEREGGDVGEDPVVEARVVAGGVEEGGDGAVGDGRVGGGGGGARVVLGAAADGDVADCEAGARSRERCGRCGGC